MFGNNAGPRGGYRPQPQKTANMLDPRIAGGMPPPPRPVNESGYTYPGNRQPDFVNDVIRRPPSGTPPMPPPPAPGRIMDGPGSGFTYPGNPNIRDGNDTRGQRPGYGNDTYYLPHSGTGGGMPPPNYYIDQGGPATAGPYGPPPGGFPPPPSRPPPVNFRPGQASSIQPQVEESPEEYRRSVAAERARAAKMDAAAAAKRQKMQQNRQGVQFDGYDNPIYDPMVIQNERDKRAAQEKARGRGEAVAADSQLDGPITAADEKATIGAGSNRMTVADLKRQRQRTQQQRQEQDSASQRARAEYESLRSEFPGASDDTLHHIAKKRNQERTDAGIAAANKELGFGPAAPPRPAGGFTASPAPPRTFAQKRLVPANGGGSRWA